MRVTPALPAILALLAGTPALAQPAPAASQGTAQPPLVSAAPAGSATPAPGTPAVIGTLSQPAPGTAGGTSLPVGKDGPVTAGMVFGGPQPAAGHNSFTRVQAARRIAAAGFANVAGLRKDTRGVWRGTAQHNGAPAAVWLDYTGKVGAS